MASGHYVAYTRVCPSTAEYASCSQTKPAPSASALSTIASKSNAERNNSGNSSSASGILRFFKPKSSIAIGAEPTNFVNGAVPVALCRCEQIVMLH